MITRIGKIGRLPQRVRDFLCLRIEDGEPGKNLVEWLQSLPEVQKIMDEQFNGQPITEQNLSHWKQEAQADWLRQWLRRELVRSVGADAEELEAEADGAEISDHVARLMAVVVARMAQVMLEETKDPAARWKLLREVNHELSRLRRDDHQAVRARIERTAWQREQERAAVEAIRDPDKELRKQMVGAYLAHLEMTDMTETLGATERAREAAGLVLEVRDNLPPGILDPTPEERERWRQRAEFDTQRRRQQAEEEKTERERISALAHPPVPPAAKAATPAAPEKSAAGEESPGTPEPGLAGSDGVMAEKSNLIQPNTTTAEGETGKNFPQGDPATVGSGEKPAPAPTATPSALDAGAREGKNGREVSPPESPS